MTLYVQPISALLTHDTELFSNMDPYVIMKIGSQSKRSRTHKQGGKKPKWDEVFTFKPKDTMMTVTVYDQDTFTDDTIGSATVDLTHYMADTQEQKDYISLTYKGKSAGKIYMGFRYQKDNGGVNPYSGWQSNGRKNNTTWGNTNQNTGWGDTGNNTGWGNSAGWEAQKPKPNSGWSNQANGNPSGWDQGNKNTSGWGNDNGNQWGNNNTGWGKQGNNNSWGNANNGNNTGWGNTGNNTGWGNQNNSEWGNNQPSNNGWGNNQNKGWTQNSPDAMLAQNLMGNFLNAQQPPPPQNNQNVMNILSNALNANMPQNPPPPQNNNWSSNNGW